MEQSNCNTPREDIMTRLTRRMTKNYQDGFNKYKKTMTIKGKGEQIDFYLGRAYLYVHEKDADRLGVGDVLAHGDRERWQITGSGRLSCGFAFFPIQQIEKWRGRPSWSGRGK